MSRTRSVGNLNNNLSWRTRFMTIRPMQAEFISTVAPRDNIPGPAASGPAGAVWVWRHDRWRRPPSFRWRRYRGRAAWRRATAALEFALATPLLVIMLGGAADYGLAQYDRAMLANAVAAGAEYATLTGAGAFQTSPTAAEASVTSVIQNTSNLPNATSAVTVSFSSVSQGAPAPGWYCVTGTGTPPFTKITTYPCSATSSTCTGTCSDGSTAGYYISFSASYTNTGLMNGFMSATTQTMTEQATVRLQ